MGRYRFMVLMFLGVSLTASSLSAASFAEKQAAAIRVKNARAEWTPKLKAAFEKVGVAYPARRAMVRVFKDDDVVELWVSDEKKGAYKMALSFPVCARSGTLGPKRVQGDGQVPEGIYHVDRFNAWSSYHLSLGLNYPNAADRVKGERPLGGDIFVHGNCVTIGCVPIEDKPIEQLYVALVDAKVAHRTKVRVEIYPFRLTDENFAKHAADVNLQFWKSLEPAYSGFEKSKEPVKFRIDKAGDYRFTTQ